MTVASFIDLLRGPITTDSVRELLDAWPGEVSVHPSSSPVALLKDIRAEGICHQNQLVHPAAIDGRPELRRFYVEAQDCYEWAYQPGEDDPRVFGRSPPDGEWREHEQRLTSFLAELIIVELSHAAPFGGFACGLSDAELDEILGPFECVLGHWHWPTTVEFFATPNAVAYTPLCQGSCRVT